MLAIYEVYSHTTHQEHRTLVIATSKLNASEAVKGSVMHVGDPIGITVGKIVSSYAWAKDFMTPTYSEPSDDWKEYLADLNLNQGLED